MKKVRTIAHIVGSLNFGGAERFVIDLCSSQRNRGYNPTIISLGATTDPLIPEAKDQQIPVNVIKGGRTGKQLKLLLKLNHFDVLHIHSPHALKFLALLLPILSKKKIIYTRHGAAPLKAKKWKRLHKFARKYIDALSFVSEEAMSNFQDVHQWKKLPILVVDNGVNLTDITPSSFDQKSDKIRLGSVGRMVPLKNQIGLLKAVKNLSPLDRQKIEVHFFGDGDCFADLKCFHDQHLLDTKVVFHGMVRERDLIYKSFDVLLVTSETEGLSIAIIEAMAYQRAIIATNVGGNPRLVENQATGWLVPYDDSKELAKCIQQLINNPSLISEMGLNGMNKVHSKFSIDASADKYETLYFQ